MRRSSKLAMLATVIMLGACNADGPTAVPAGGPVLLNIVSGDAQVGDPGKELAKALVVIATDEKGKPVKGQLVNFRVVTGGGSLFAGSSITDQKGQAQDYWTLGASGKQTVEVRAVDASTGQKFTYATFNATFPPPPDIDADGDGFLGSVDCNDAEPAIHPGATDDPDDAFIDMNCDGLDGNKATAVFVSRTGLNVSTCGSMAAPCERITYGIAQAIALGRSRVFVAMGDYPETVTLVNGINLYGGYAANFSSRSFDNRATVNGSAPLDGTPGQLFTMLASDLTQPTIVSALILRGGDATTGGSSHTLVIRNDPTGNFRLSRTRILAGNGGDGVSGANGANGLSTAAGAGSAGGAAGTVGVCDDGSRGAPGANGTTSAGGGNGGRGGTGGFADANCNIFSLDLSARAGQDGGDGFPFAAPFGFGGGGAGACFAGGSGDAGRTSHGADGVGGSGITVVNGFVVTIAGVNGSLGLNGTGGGGGGGSGGCDNNGNAFGAGGGGGGAGGARAPSAGTGGGGGGASVGIFVMNASPSLTNVEIVRGRGGNGGAGGSGGRGQFGGNGGAGGAAAGGGGAGGAGGRGGDGGNSGSGGGGAGGASIGILITGAAPVADAGVNYSLGTGGAGGSGGVGPVGAAPGGVAGVVATTVIR